MKKGIIVVIMCLLLAACSATQASSPLDFQASIESTDLSMEIAGGVQLGETEQALLLKLGQPLGKFDLKLKGSDQYDTPQYLWEYDDVHYTIRESVLVGYTIQGEGTTEKGIKLGSSIESVKDMYGDAFYNRDYKEMKILGYINKKKEWVIEFASDSDKVTSILVSQLSSFETK